MSGPLASGLVAALLVLAAVVAGWPGPGRRARRRRVLAASKGRPGGLATRPALPAPPMAGVGQRWLAGQRWVIRYWRRVTAQPGWPTGRAPLVALVGVGTLLAMALGGPVAAGLAVGYGTLAARAAAARARRRRARAGRVELLERVSGASADLRAGLPASQALAEAGLTRAAGGRLADQLRCAVQLAERTGAPLADVLGRIEADARSADRATAAAAAQVAGARATVWMLACLPLGGVGLGYVIGADPLPVLLHSPIGAACAFGALLLQLAGLGWSGRITRPPRQAGP